MIDAQISHRPALEPVLPLINIVFLLLIFFMVAGNFSSPPPASIELPEDSGVIYNSRADQLALTLDANGHLDAAVAQLDLHIDFSTDRVPTTTVQLKGVAIELLADRTVRGEYVRKTIRWLNTQGASQVLLISLEGKS